MELQNHYIWSPLDRISYYTISTLCNALKAAEDAEATAVGDNSADVQSSDVAYPDKIIPTVEDQNVSGS